MHIDYKNEIAKLMFKNFSITFPVTLVLETIPFKNTMAWRDELRIANNLMLLCRYCKQKVPLSKYMVSAIVCSSYKTHTDTCLNVFENKKQMLNIDQTLLDFGETMTDRIRVLSKKMYSFLHIYL